MVAPARLDKSERRRLRKLEKSDRQQRKKLELVEQAKYISEGQSDKPRVKPLQAKTEAQGHYILSIKSSTLTFGVGPAGTGKTYVAAAMAADALANKEIERIILTRPAVEAEESMGFLPGDLAEKYDPYIAPVKNALVERLGAGTVKYMLKSGIIVPLPLAFMRGHTFNDAWVILDEAQNTTAGQMKMFMTRIGHNCTVIVNGDPSQRDITETSGLDDALYRFSDSDYANVCHFVDSDCVRSGFAREALSRYA